MRLKIYRLKLHQQVFYFCGRVGGGGVEKWRLKLTSAKVKVEVEAELGNLISECGNTQIISKKNCITFILQDKK